METSSLIGLSLLVTAIIYIYISLKSLFSYWKDRGIPYVGPTILFKVVKDLLLGRITLYGIHNMLYNTFGSYKYGGYYDFTIPTLMVRDPELIERVLVKDFNYFIDRGMTPASEDDILSLNLANVEGDRWRTLRYKLTPTFTSGKLKGMFEQMSRACDDLIRYIDEGSSKNDSQLDGKPLMNRFGMNVIATCAFGIEFSYHDKERDRFQSMVKQLVTPSFTQILRTFAQIYCPAVFTLFRINVFDPEVCDYFVGLIDEAFRFRKENKIRRNDFLQLLLDLKNSEDDGADIRNEETVDCEPEDAVVNQMHLVSGGENKSGGKNKHTFRGAVSSLSVLQLQQFATLVERKQHFETLLFKKIFTIKNITAQAAVFLTAGAEGASGTMNFFLFCMATHPYIQRKLQKEVDQILHRHGQWSYEMLKQMTYVDQVIQETMRMYPTSVILMRKCTKPYLIPDSDAVIEPGTRIIIPTYSLHYDPQYYPNPQKFDPDRWVGTNYKPNGQFLPFGDGPRICIAMRFALLEMKVCLTRLIAEYNITLGSKTQMPLQFDQRSIAIIMPKGGTWLKFEKRKPQLKSQVIQQPRVNCDD